MSPATREHWLDRWERERDEYEDLPARTPSPESLRQRIRAVDAEIAALTEVREILVELLSAAAPSQD